MFISATQLLIAILVAVGCFWIGRKLFDFDTAIEAHRKAAGVIASVLERYGMRRLAGIFRDFSVGDNSGWINALIDLGKELRSGGLVKPAA